MRKVIFVGGTSFSGSTFFHMQLANHKAAFACGEAVWLFHPSHQRHVNRLRFADQETRQIWREVVDQGRERTYLTIFEMFPEVQWIVDSSKHPFWQWEHAQQLRAEGIDTRHILIWKTPEEFAASTKKRNRFSTWETDWIDYHRLYFSCFAEWRGVSYRDLAQDPAKTLAAACSTVGIPYHQGMEEYWTRGYHTLGGNVTARYHLADPEKAQAMLNGTFDQSRMEQYRRTQYSPVTDPEIITAVEVARRSNSLLSEIEEFLKIRSIPDAQEIEVPNELRYSTPTLVARQMKRRVQESVGRLRYTSQIKEALSA